LDPITLSEIVRIQLEDTYQLAKDDKGKGRQGHVNDAQLALQMLQDDLRDCDATLKDRRLAQSIATAVLQDGDFIYRAYQNEQQIERDRELAMRLAGGEASRAGTTAPAHTSRQAEESDVWSDEEMLAKAAALYMPKPKHPEIIRTRRQFTTQIHAVAESSARAATRQESQGTLKGQCVACSDKFDFYDVARVPCDHEYCRGCLAELFTLSMKDESLFPPRCCRSTIPLSRVRFFLPNKLADEFKEKAVELGTKNRVYCHSGACSTFIPPDKIDSGTDTATCPVCEKTTCTMCRQVAHSGDCPEDTALQQLIEIANQKQWQRCYECHAFVELDTGCNHMRCRYCKAEFCYVCGQRWKTCECEQWAEGRLTARAIEVIDRDPNRRIWPSTQPARETYDTNQQRRQLLARTVEHLRENHVCSHRRWSFVQGRHRCEECQHVLNKYIFDCAQCHLRACNRC
ncbi:hypothetical protein K431DRAFT_213455, partial [Polychaeton citri CBS 116435]